MCEDNRHCPECDGENGFHYGNCTYDGTNGPGNCSFGSKKSSNQSGGKFWLFYIVALVIGYGINELLGAIILIGLIIWLCICK